MKRGKYAPKDLGPAGRRLYRDTVARFDGLTPGELVVLGEAARAADECAALSAEIAHGASRAQRVELRAHRASLADLVGRLGI